jgi:DivIVA domain-containing protein
MSSTPESARYPNLASLETVQFRQQLKGYNVNDVDAYLTALVTEVAGLQADLAASQREVADLRAQSSP